MAPNNSTTDPPPNGSTTISLAGSVAGVALQKILLNSANPSATTTNDLLALAGSSATGAFTTRTACPNFEHNDAIHQWRAWGSSDDKNKSQQGGNTINCLGYSCQDVDYYVEAVQTVQAATAKPCFFSVSGYAEQVRDIVTKLSAEFKDSATAVLVEINLSCPNIKGKPPIAYDFDGMQAYLTTVFEGYNVQSSSVKVGVKTTPYFYQGQFDAAAAVLNGFVPNLQFVTCINTVGCGLVIDMDTEAPVLADAGGASLGGLGGPAVHATALGNVRMLRKLLSKDIDVVGCGGVDSGAAVFRHLLCGASAVMAASVVLTQGVSALDRIEGELLEIMASKGYTSVEQFIGKLKD